MVDDDTVLVELVVVVSLPVVVVVLGATVVEVVGATVVVVGRDGRGGRGRPRAEPVGGGGQHPPTRWVVVDAPAKRPRSRRVVEGATS